MCYILTDYVSRGRQPLTSCTPFPVLWGCLSPSLPSDSGDPDPQKLPPPGSRFGLNDAQSKLLRIFIVSNFSFFKFQLVLCFLEWASFHIFIIKCAQTQVLSLFFYTFFCISSHRMYSPQWVCLKYKCTEADTERIGWNFECICFIAKAVSENESSLKFSRDYFVKESTSVGFHRALPLLAVISPRIEAPIEWREPGAVSSRCFRILSTHELPKPR